jgi:hypothetical protein
VFSGLDKHGLNAHYQTVYREYDYETNDPPNTIPNPHEPPFTNYLDYLHVPPTLFYAFNFTNLPNYPLIRNDFHTRQEPSEKFWMSTHSIAKLRILVAATQMVVQACQLFGLHPEEVEYVEEASEYIDEEKARMNNTMANIDRTPVVWHRHVPTPEPYIIRTGPEGGCGILGKVVQVVPDEEIKQLKSCPNEYAELPPYFPYSGCDYFFDHCNSSNPYIRNSIINQAIPAARNIRCGIQQLLIRISDFTLQSPFYETLRSFPDSNPLKHYAYAHHIYARIISPFESPAVQGFQHICIHESYNPDTTPTSINALLLDEEDEFLVFATGILDYLGYIELSNAIRELRSTPIMHDAEVRLLLQHGFLDPVDYFDHFGHRRRIRPNITL